MKRAFKKVNVVGLGYVGLPTAAILATNGVEVVGVEVNQTTIASINAGRPHFVEAALDTLLQAVVTSKSLRATDTPEPADCFIIAVPTPFISDSQQADMSYVKAAARAIAPVLRQGDLVILESTSPVGTTQRMCEILQAERTDLKLPHVENQKPDVHVAHCPERVMPGRVLRELTENARIIGGMTPACSQRAREFYRIFVQGECILTDARTAELAKLAENAYRDVNIAFANELSSVCDQLGINVWELIRLSNHHPRVNILQPGPGVGGHCIAVDPWFIVASAPQQTKLIRAAREVNDARPQQVVQRIREAASRFTKPRIACLGLAFKPNIDDLRQSPAVEIVETLAAQQIGQLLVVEPHIRVLPGSLSTQDNVRLVTLDEATKMADVVVLLVHHRQFIELDRGLLNGKVIVDTRGVWC